MKAFGGRVEERYVRDGVALDELAPESNHPRSTGDNHSSNDLLHAAEDLDNPYVWDPDAQRWFDPDSGFYVSFRDAGRYVHDPYLHYMVHLEPGRR